MRKGVIPDCIPAGEEHLYPALRDKNGLKVDCFPGVDPEEAIAKDEYEHLETLNEKPKRGAKSDA